MTAVIEKLSRSRLLQVLAFVGFMTGTGVSCLAAKYSVLDPDIWWHLKVGDWIIQRGAVPHTGLFSYTAGNRPWVAYSWGYEVLLSRAYAWFGLVGIGIFGLLLILLVAGTVFWMAHRLSRSFWVAWALAVISCSAFLFNIMPRPVFFSMALFAVTLTIILEAQRGAPIRQLYYLPLIFLLWANLHIQFVYGLFLLGLFVGINLIQRLGEAANVLPEVVVPSRLPVSRLVGIFAACVLASCVGPYSYHLYQVILEYSQQKVTYSTIMELQALSFTTSTHFLVLVLAAAAFFAVGWRRKLDLFKLALLVFATVVAFRTQRDAWFICIPAAAVIADFPVPETSRDRAQLLWQRVTAALALALLLVVFARVSHFDSRELDRAISSQYPVNAANFLRKNPMPGPLYNSFDWGGFLIWYMPQYPVAIDGRNDLYGDNLHELFLKSEGADAATYESDPYLNRAGLVLLKKDVPLAQVLSVDDRFTAIYRDDMSVIFVRN